MEMDLFLVLNILIVFIYFLLPDFYREVNPKKAIDVTDLYMDSMKEHLLFWFLAFIRTIIVVFNLLPFYQSKYADGVTAKWMDWCCLSFIVSFCLGRFFYILCKKKRNKPKKQK